MRILNLLLSVSFIWFVSGASATVAPELKVSIDDSNLVPVAGGTVLSYADVLESATPSVVAVYTSRTVASPSGSRQVPDLFRQFGLPVPPQTMPNNRAPRERREQLGVGSGVIISEDGFIITNHHVVAGENGRQADSIRVLLGDGTEYEAKLVGSDSKTDVAVLKVEAPRSLPALTLADSEKLRVGDVVFAIGNPLDVGLTATQGIVSATGRHQGGRILGPGSYEDFIQTDAAINLGNSGGALIDARGRLVGINTAIVSRSGGSIGIGFAIPVNMVLNVASNLIATGEVPRGMLGLFPTDLNADLAEAFGLDSTKGALVNQVQPDSPAAQAGIQHGDVIVQVDDLVIESAQQLRLRVSQMLPGREVRVRLIRQGETLELPVTLGSLDGSSPDRFGEKETIVMGARLRALDAVLREQLSVPEDVNGVLVVEVDSDSPFADRLRPMMLILEVNGTAVSSPAEVEPLLQTGRGNRLYVWFDGMPRFIALQL